tara:strand:- start:43 stop:306 length:264 start_codon:yes stop_codon:yes gene_type:complete
MSADNWDECPICGEGDDTKHIHMNSPSYKKKFDKYGGDHRKTPLREDYEIYWSGNGLNIHYRCTCYSCGFEHKAEIVEEAKKGTKNE